MCSLTEGWRGRHGRKGFARVAEEVHTVYLQDKWAKMEARNLKRFVAAVGGLSALELTRLVAKPKEALPRRYDTE